MELSRIDAATALGIDPTSLDAWVRRGAPVIEKNGKGTASRYSLPALIAWRIETETARALDRAERAAGPEELDALRARRIELQNERAELELAARKGELVDVDQIALHTDRLILGGRSALMNAVPQRVAARMRTETGASVAEVVRSEMDAALNEWSRTNVVAAFVAAGCSVDVDLLAGCDHCRRVAADCAAGLALIAAEDAEADRAA